MPVLTDLEYPVWAIVAYKHGSPLYDAAALKVGVAVYQDTSRGPDGGPDSKLVLSPHGDHGQSLRYFGRIQKRDALCRRKGDGAVSASCVLVLPERQKEK